MYHSSYIHKVFYNRKQQKDGNDEQKFFTTYGELVAPQGNIGLSAAENFR